MRGLKAGYGIVLLVGAFFFGWAIVFLATVPVDETLAAWEMRAWQPAEAEMLSLRLDKGGRARAPTVRLQVRYRYTFAGSIHESGRVALDETAEAPGGYLSALYERLNRARKKGEPVTVWVDPADPARAIIDREPRLGLLAFKYGFGLLFAAVGAALLASPFASGKGAPPASVPPAAANPGPVRSEGKRLLLRDWLIALALLGVSVPLLLQLEQELRHGNWPAFIGLVFPAVGAGFLVAAVRRTLEWRRFGDLRLALDPDPGAIGGDVGGSVELPLLYRPGQSFQVALSCILERRERRNAWTEVVWHVEGAPRAMPLATGTRLSFRFAVPAGLPESEPPGPRRHRWLLRVKAALPGTDLDRSFEIPLRHGAARSRLPEAVPPPPAPQPAERVRVGRDDHGAILIQAPAPTHLAGAVSATALALLLGGPAAFLMQLPPLSLVGAFAWMIALPLAALALLMAVMAVDSGCASTQARLSPDAIDLRKRLFGLPFSTARFAPADIAAVEVRRSSRVARGTKVSTRHRVRVRLTDRRRFTLVDGLVSAEAGEDLARLIEGLRR